MRGINFVAQISVASIPKRKKKISNDSGENAVRLASLPKLLKWGHGYAFGQEQECKNHLLMPKRKKM